MKEYYEGVLSDALNGGVRPIYVLFSFMAKMPWSPQYYSSKNYIRCFEVVSKYVDSKLTDENCVLFKLLKQNPQKRSTIIADIMGF